MIYPPVDTAKYRIAEEKPLPEDIFINHIYWVWSRKPEQIIYTESAVKKINDLSEEFIEFITTVGAGNPIDTAAVGAYYGRARVSVAGVAGFKYVALYDP